MWELKACRCCLTTDNKLEKISETCTRLYAAATGLQFKPGDGYPNYFCVECHTQLKKCLAFRRKSRRAFFALQTIMNSRKQITKTDVEKVNRKQNSLTSSLGNCQPNQMHCVKVAHNTESDDNSTVPLSARDLYQQQGMQMTAIEPLVETYQPVSVGHVYQVIDIQSADIPMEDDRDNEPTVDESDVREETEPNIDNIDLDDVFKDFEDDTNDDDDKWELPETETESKEDKNNGKRIKKQKDNKQATTRANIRTTVDMLENCDIIPLSIEEMKENYKARCMQKPFAKAVLKCIICVKVFPVMDDLIAHVHFHNRSEAVIPCTVCPLRLTSHQDLLLHEAEVHNYLYHCQLCDKDCLTLMEFKQHFTSFMHMKQNSINDLRQYYDIVETTPAEMYDSLNHFCVVGARHRCAKCNMRFKSILALQQHVAMHTEPSPPTFQCDICQLWFPKIDWLMTHMSDYHKYKYTCKLCKCIKFSRLEANEHRQATKHEVKKTRYQCEICSTSSFVKKFYLKTHITAKHYTEFYTHHCVKCGQSFAKKKALLDHQLTEYGRIILPSQYLGEIQFMCIYCQVQFMNEDAYKRHVVSHNHPEARDIPLACLRCKKIFSSESEFRNHSHVKKVAYYCGYCDLSFTNAKLHKRHCTSAHPGMPYVKTVLDSDRYALCEHCGESVHVSARTMHYKAHEKTVIICEECGEKLSSNETLAVHILTRHTLRAYRCVLCPAAYKLRWKARDHILKTHAPVRPYSCEWCPLKFSFMEFYSEHASQVHNQTVKKPQIQRRHSPFCTYPHLQVDISKLSEDIVSKLSFTIMDYNDQNVIKLEDYRNFFLTNPPPLDPVYMQTSQQTKQIFPKKNPEKRRKLTNVNKEGDGDMRESKVRKSKARDGDLGNIDVRDNKLGDFDVEVKAFGDIDVGDSSFGDVDVRDENLKYIELKDRNIMETEVESQLKAENSKMEIDMAEGLVLDPTMDYPVLEQNGEKYVLVENALYKVEFE